MELCFPPFGTRTLAFTAEITGIITYLTAGIRGRQSCRVTFAQIILTNKLCLCYPSKNRVQRGREETKWRTQKNILLEACSNLEQTKNTVQFVFFKRNTYKECGKPIKLKVGAHKTAAGPSVGLHRLHPR